MRTWRRPALKTRPEPRISVGWPRWPSSTSMESMLLLIDCDCDKPYLQLNHMLCVLNINLNHQPACAVQETVWYQHCDPEAIIRQYSKCYLVPQESPVEHRGVDRGRRPNQSVLDEVSNQGFRSRSCLKKNL